MEVLTLSLNGAFVLVMTLVLTWYIRDRFAEQDKRIAELRLEIRAELTGFRSEMTGLRGELTEVRTDLRTEFREEIAGVRSDLLAIALAVGAQPRPNTA